MSIKRLFKKNFFGGGMIQGHIMDAIQKKKETGKSFRECLEESVKETFTEDLPGTSHIYNMGRKVGRVQGTIEQAERDEVKMKQMKEYHDKDRKHWQEINRKKDELLDRIENNIDE